VKNVCSHLTDVINECKRANCGCHAGIRVCDLRKIWHDHGMVNGILKYVGVIGCVGLYIPPLFVINHIVEGNTGRGRLRTLLDRLFGLSLVDDESFRRDVLRCQTTSLILQYRNVWRDLDKAWFFIRCRIVPP